MLHGREFLEFRMIQRHVRAMLDEREADRRVRAAREASTRGRRAAGGGRGLFARTLARTIGLLGSALYDRDRPRHAAPEAAPSTGCCSAEAVPRGA